MSESEANQSSSESESTDFSLEAYPKFQPQVSEKAKASALEVHVDHSVERAMKILKRKLIKEGLFKELKSRRFYEKPSQRKKRKLKESLKKMRKEESRRKKNQFLF